MTENRAGLQRWYGLLRVVAIILAAALLLSLVLPSAAGVVSAGTEGEQELTDSAASAESYENHKLLADLAIADSSYEDAISHLEKARALAEGVEDSEFAALCLKTASVYVLTGQLDKALPLLDETLELDSSSADALLLRAQLAIERGDNEAAVSDLKRYTELAPEDLSTRMVLAQLREAVGDYEGAMAEYELLYEKQSSDESHFLNALRCRFLSGDYDEALAKFDLYVEDSTQDSLYYPVALFLRAACLLQLGRIEQAEAGFTEAMQHGYDEGNCLEQIMLCCFERGAYQQTVDYGEQLLEMAAQLNTPELFYQRMGASMMLLERYEEAVEHLDKAAELELELVGNAYYRGVSLLALERYEEAAEDFTASIEQGFLPQFCYYNRGVCYVQLLDYENAVKDMTMTLNSGDDAGLIAAAEDIILQIADYYESRETVDTAQ